MSPLPKLRADLVVRPHVSTHGTSVIVKDPATRRFFRFGEVEHFVAQQLDGVTSFEVIRGRVEERFGRPLPESTLRRFLDQFRRLQLLEDAAEPPGAGSKRNLVRGSPFYIRVKAFDPDRLLEWLVPRVSVVFTRAFLIVSALAIAAAVGATATEWQQFTHDLSRLYRFDALLLAWVAVLIVTTAHELAHGVTCKRFGGEVNEIGFMLLYFQPAFYCNVSDAWLIPEKSKRLWVSFAGAYCEMVIWAMATLAWRVTESDTLINFVALVIMVTSGAKTIFNLNPLIKLDGYYLLSDLLEIPNLRQKSIAAVKVRLRRAWNLSSDALRVHGREDRIYLAYGVLAAAYSISLTTLIVWRFGGFLTTRYGGLGLIAFVSLLATAFQRPLRQLTSAARPSSSEPVAERGPSRPRRLILAALLLIAAGMVPAELKVSGGFRILPGHNAEIRAQIDGTIADVRRDEGDRVTQGDIIVRLDDRDYRTELAKTNAEIDEKQARLDLLQAGPRQEEVDLARTELATATIRHQNGEQTYEESHRLREAELSKARTSVEKAEQQLRLARSEMSRVQALFAEELVPRRSVEETEALAVVRQKELEEAQSAVQMVLAGDPSDARRERDVASQELGRAQGRLRVLMAGSRPEEIKANQAEIARLEAQRTYLLQQLRLLEVTTPSSGVVATAKLKERVGERVSRGDLIAKVFEQDRVTAEILIPENEIADVAMGQLVVFKARAFPEKTFASRITSIAPVAVEDEGGLGNRAVRVVAEIENRSQLLKAEMTGSAKIYAGGRRVFQLALRRAARLVRVELWSWW